jgi:ribosome biogenesis GTPase
MVREGGAQPVILLNKADLVNRAMEQEAETRAVAGHAAVLTVSALTGRGMDQVRSYIRAGKTVVFVGSSGVGKSSLINRLYGEEIQATIEVRETDAKGRHTTTWRELILLPGGGLVIDTPGMREFHMWTAEEGLQEAFPDLEELALRCHFRSCTHTNEKRCALREAVAAGNLESKRLENYLKLKREVNYLAEERRQHTYDARRRPRR